MNLLKKTKMFKWDQECEKSFSELENDTSYATMIS